MGKPGEANRNLDVKSIIDGFKIDYQSTDLQAAYQRLRDKINLDDYFEYDRINRDTGKQYSGLFHFALNVRVLPEGGFIPFLYINHSDKEKEKEIYAWAADSLREGKIKYNFTDFLQDSALEPIIEKYPHSEFFFKTRYDNDHDRHLISDLEVQEVFYSKPVAVDNDIIEAINKRLIGLNEVDFIQQMSELYFRKSDEKPYFISNPNGEFLFAIYSFDSDYKTNLKLTNFLVIAESKDEIEYFVNHRIRKIRDLASLFRIRFTRDILRKQELEAIKSAKAAIMSRNISHNLGSHVMAYMKHDLSSVEDMLNKGVLKSALPCDAVTADEIKKKEIPYLVGVGKFISYLQERQDYIATVSTDYIPYPSVVNFKDSIYDELNPDYRFQRHTEWAGHKPANILLKNIAKSEGLSRKTLEEGEIIQDSNNIIIKYGSFDGLNQDKAKEDYEKLRNWNFSLPGGIMGRQAVFSIVENVIRNAAKHGSREYGANLIVTFEIIDPMIDQIEDPLYSQAVDIRDLYIVKLTTNSSINDAGLQKVKDAINDTLVEANGQLKQSNKGIKEMQISAAWLRGIKIEDLEDEQIKRQAPILTAQKTHNGELQYVFCLPKVKEVAMVTERLKVDGLTEVIQQLMKQKGWYVFTVEEYIKYPNKDFSFVIIDPQIWEDKYHNTNNKSLIEKGIKDSTVECIRKVSHNRYFVAAGSTNLDEHLITTDLFDKFQDFKTESDFDDAFLNLYAQLANYSNGEIIAIADKDFKDQYNANGKTECQKVKLLDDSMDDARNYDYIYRKHNDTTDLFNNFAKGYGKSRFYHKLKFVEGITGGNSTDRLVRHMNLDDLWVYKQMHAMKTRIAIFDERLFTKVTGCEMTDLTETPVKKWDFDGLNIEEGRQKIYDYDKKHGKIIKNDIYDEWEALESIDDINAFADKYLPLPIVAPEVIDTVNPMVFHKKGVDVFTITWKNEGVFNIWGFVPDETLGEDCYGQMLTIGQLIIDPKGREMPKVRLFIGSDEPSYNYLSIHQGLLDKVYEMFSEEISDSIIDTKKMEVTKALHSKFLARCDGNDYLQGMIVHSGRSKPNEENMPQHQPFVQYSAIENAIFDCKYTLVELLDFACFE